MAPLVSIIIPVRDDSRALQALLQQLPPQADVEIIVSHAGSDAATVSRRSDVRWIEGPPGRGQQLNAGAAVATGKWFWFVHADSELPANWRAAFAALDAEPDLVGGSFRLALDSQAWQARLLERAVVCRVALFDLPYGDQGIFVRREVFQRMGGYRPLPLMEDVEFVRRLNRLGRLRHLTLSIRTSARRWEREGWWRRSGANLTLLGLYWLGVSPDRLARRYYRRR